MSFYDTFVYQITPLGEGEKNAWTEATFEKMYAMREDYKTFRKNLKFADLTEKTLTEFVVYLRDVKKLRTPRKCFQAHKSKINCRFNHIWKNQR